MCDQVSRALEQLGCLIALDEGELSPRAHYCWSGVFQCRRSAFSSHSGATNQQFNISHSDSCFDDDLFSKA